MVNAAVGQEVTDVDDHVKVVIEEHIQPNEAEEEMTTADQGNGVS